MKSLKTSVVAIYLVACFVIISATPSEGMKEAISIVHENKLEHIGDTKGVPFAPPAFLANAMPKPVVFASAATQGEAGGLFAANNNTLISYGGPASDNVAIASLNSTSFYFAIPINETKNETSPDGTGTYGSSLGGYSITAAEDTQAYAVGELIQFINNGGSYATAAAESTANGTTNNPGNGNSDNGSGWGATQGAAKPSKPPQGNESNKGKPYKPGQGNNYNGAGSESNKGEQKPNKPSPAQVNSGQQKPSKPGQGNGSNKGDQKPKPRPKPKDEEEDASKQDE